MLQNRLLLSVVAAVLLGFGFYNFALKPKQQEASDLETQVETAQTELDSARALLASNTQARESFKQAYSTVVRLGKAVPGDDDVRSLVVQLDQSATKSGVSFESINVEAATAGPASSDSTASASQLPPGATVGPAGFPVMPFTFEFKGQFFKLGSFFRKLDSYVKSDKQLSINGRLLTIDGLKLEPDTTGFPNIRATVTATSYLVSPLEGATGGASPAGPAAAPVSEAVGGSDSTTATAMEDLP